MRNPSSLWHHSALRRARKKWSMPNGKTTNSQAGFTLIEVLVVIVIIVLLASLVGPRVIGYLGSSRTKTAKVQIENFATALELYKLDTGSYPTSGAGLAALVQSPSGGSGWNGPYLNKKNVPKDPWGTDYQYRFPGTKNEYDIYTLGADNQAGGDKENTDVYN